MCLKVHSLLYHKIGLMSNEIALFLYILSYKIIEDAKKGKAPVLSLLFSVKNILQCLSL